VEWPLDRKLGGPGAIENFDDQIRCAAYQISLIRTVGHEQTIAIEVDNRPIADKWFSYAARATIGRHFCV